MMSEVALAPPWHNFAGTLTSRPSEHRYARSVDDVRAAVVAARDAGLPLRPVGASHSYSPVVATDGMLVDVAALTGVLAVDEAARRVRVGAGTRISALGDPLWERGLALRNQGDIDSQTVAGAVSTATHGSGLAYGSFSSVVTGMELVTGDGEVLGLVEGDPRLSAAATAVGTFGVITSVELQVMDAYQLVESNDHWSLAEVCDRWTEEIATQRHFSFFWGPYSDSLAMYDLPNSPVAGQDCYVKRYEQIGAEEQREPRPGVRVDRSYRIFADEYPPSFDELEYFVPIEATVEALRSLTPVLRAHPGQRHPVEVRAIAREASLMSPMYGRDSASISVSGLVGTEYQQFLRDVDRALRDFDARPHWGKNHFFDAARLARVFPDSYDEFVRVRRSLDPSGVFLNEHTAALFS